MICKVELYFEIETQPGEVIPLQPQLIIEEIISKNKNFETILLKKSEWFEGDKPLIQARLLTRKMALLRLTQKK